MNQLLLTHLYPQLAGLSEQERRQALVDSAGVYSSKQLDQAGFDVAMARLEEILWERVDAGSAPDPRLCRVCGRGMRRGQGGRGTCPEGCESRMVAAWSRTYWRDRLPKDGMANRRAIWKLRELWELLKDMLPEEERTEEYLAAMVGKAAGGDGKRFLKDGLLDVRRLPAGGVQRTIEALKDRLRYAVR